jgi:hypothetical protein
MEERGHFSGWDYMKRSVSLGISNMKRSFDEAGQCLETDRVRGGSLWKQSEACITLGTGNLSEHRGPGGFTTMHKAWTGWLRCLNFREVSEPMCRWRVQRHVHNEAADRSWAGKQWVTSRHPFHWLEWPGLRVLIWMAAQDTSYKAEESGHLWVTSVVQMEDSGVIQNRSGPWLPWCVGPHGTLVPLQALALCLP